MVQGPTSGGRWLVVRVEDLIAVPAHIPPGSCRNAVTCHVTRLSRVSTRGRAWAFPTLSLSATGAVCLPLARVCLQLSLSLCILRRLQCRPLAPKAFLALACFPLPTLVTLRSFLGHWHYLIPWISLRS